MIQIDIPNRGTIALQHAVFDINGTLAVDGIPIPGVADCLQSLADLLSIHLLTAGTHGNLTALEQTLGHPLHIIQNGEEKAAFVQQLGPESVIAFGNGANDTLMLRLAAIGVGVLNNEGMSTGVLLAADVLTASPVDAIQLVLHPKRLIATLRK